MLRALQLAIGCAAAADVVRGTPAGVGSVAAHRHRGGVAAAPADEARFAAFLQEHGREYERDSDEYVMRLRAFQQRLSAVEAHNARLDKLWTAGVNALADRTPDELASLRGYVHGARAEGGGQRGQLGLVGSSARTVDTAKLPKDFNWQQLQAMKDVKDQGSCGSCWAVSSATVLRAHAELYQRDRTFSVQQIIDCTPNPKSCGGNGGCSGATAELAMDYIAKAGSTTEEERRYAGHTTSCPMDMSLTEPSSPKRALRAASSLSEVYVHDGGGAKFGMVGWRRLPENKAQPLLLALYERGPVVVSVAANDHWNMYATGILSACDKDAVINHAVVLTGFGEDGPAKYWQIQNSWGASWGERGFVRLERKDTRDEDAYCGWDTSPEKGTGCKGGPSKVRVCGSCGILYDNVVPLFVLSDGGLMKKLNHLNSTA
mmetsp:Transcript_7006/g.19892  ORF Transcript_7006/g.19892 Transcript_7006/m.19892 type:complete len:431 (-) Transcript_7006:104-1396(-)